MTAEELAALYARAFPERRPWTAGEIAALSAGPGFCVTTAAGFAIGRVSAGEAELVTLAVDPRARRQGQGRGLLAAFERAARQAGAAQAFLEVAVDNEAALALYHSAGWRETGRRPGYYARATGAVDAAILAKALS